MSTNDDQLSRTEAAKIFGKDVLLAMDGVLCLVCQEIFDKGQITDKRIRAIILKRPVLKRGLKSGSPMNMDTLISSIRRNLEAIKRLGISFDDFEVDHYLLAQRRVNRTSKAKRLAGSVVGKLQGSSSGKKSSGSTSSSGGFFHRIGSRITRLVQKLVPGAKRNYVLGGLTLVSSVAVFTAFYFFQAPVYYLYIGVFLFLSLGLLSI